MSKPKSLFDPAEPHLSVLSLDEANKVGERIYAMSKTHRTAVSVVNRMTNYSRFAVGEVSHAGSNEGLTVSISASFEGKTGKITTNRTDDAGLREALRQAEVMATYHRLPPPRPAAGSAAAPPSTVLHTQVQQGNHDDHDGHDHDAEAGGEAREFLKPKLWFDSTARSAGAVHRAAIVQRAIERARDAECHASGFVQLSGYSLALLSRSGNGPYADVSNGYFSMTARSKDGTGSGWAGRTYEDWSRIDPDFVIARAIDLAQRSRNPVAVEPGRYTVVLEANAVGTLLSTITQSLDAEMADHGMSPFAKRGGGNKIGMQVMDERISILADPMDPDGGFVPFDDHGRPLYRTMWIENGVLKNLAYEEAYARRKGVEPLGNSEAGRMTGGNATVEEMIASTKYGLYINRLSSVQVFHQASLMLSGTTRDGVFLIENGKVTKPVKNFRFNESPMFIFNKVEMLGVPERVAVPGPSIVAPPMKVNDFTMTSLTDAV